MAKLVLLRGHPPQRIFSLFHNDSVRIGRKVPKDEICIEDGCISRAHAIILYEDGKYMVHDLHSTNGTYVNGSSVEKHHLKDGDVITVGQCMLRFQGTAISGGEEIDIPTRVSLRTDREGTTTDRREFARGCLT